MNWQISNTTSEGRWEIAGDLEITSVASLRERLLEITAAPEFEQLDLFAVTACDLASLQLLVAFRKGAKAGAPTPLLNPSPAILSACSSMGVDSTIFTTPECVGKL